MIAMVDTSCSMETYNCQPLYNAIGLGIRIAELSKLGKRVLTFSHNPEWINLDNEKTFCDMVNKVKKASWSGNTDIYKAFKLILDVIENRNINISISIKNTCTDFTILLDRIKMNKVCTKVDNVKKFTVVDNPVQPVFKINRKENAPTQKKTKIKKKKSKKSKRKPRKVSFTVKKTRAKKMNLKNKKSDEMLDELKNKGITVSGKSDRLVRDIYMCIMNDNIEIKKE